MIEKTEETGIMRYSAKGSVNRPAFKDYSSKGINNCDGFTGVVAHKLAMKNIKSGYTDQVCN